MLCIPLEVPLMHSLPFSIKLRRFGYGGIFEIISRAAARFGVTLAYSRSVGVLYLSYRCVAFGGPLSLCRFRRFLLFLRDFL